MRRFASLHVPLYAVILILLAVAAGATVFIERFRETVYQYDVFVRGATRSDRLEFGSWPALQNAEFFRDVKARLMNEGVNFIEANLSEMKLRVYTAGVAVKEVPILTKGREGSWWETPAGLYKIDGKERDHFSAFAGVHMPWSMPFQGNFFIHGWPYYPSGKPVDTRYSGGCIRLSTEDAGAVYALAATGMPVLVYETDNTPDGFSYASRMPPLTARHYLAADLRNNFVFAEKDADTVVPVASLAKLMTAIVAVEYVDIERSITVGEAMIASTTKPRLVAGRSYSLFNLLHPLLMESSNEAAEAIAGFLGRERFIALMNKKARAIGMEHAVFTDPAGREEANVASAEDLFALAKHLYANRGFILRMSAGKIDERVYGPLAFRDLENFNGFGNDPSFIGGKVGKSTAAGETILSIFEMPEGVDTRPIVVIALGAEGSIADADALIRWVAERYAPAGAPSPAPTSP